jgi:hypothetical protein
MGTPINVQQNFTATMTTIGIEIVERPVDVDTTHSEHHLLGVAIAERTAIAVASPFAGWSIGRQEHVEGIGEFVPARAGRRQGFAHRSVLLLIHTIRICLVVLLVFLPLLGGCLLSALDSRS